MRFGLEIPTCKPFDAVAFGLNAVDHLIVVPRFPDFNTKLEFSSHLRAPGGQCATAMVTLARLGLRTSYIGKVGSDETGEFQLKSISSEGVDVSKVMVAQGAESQLAFIIVDAPTGERTILWHRDDKLIIQPDEVDRNAVTAGRVLHLDGHNVAASIRAAEFARQAGVPTVLDIDNYYPGTHELLPLIDFLICSSDFSRRATGESDLRKGLIELADQTGSHLVAATVGREGVIGLLGGQWIESRGFEVECRDTTGAGDAFHGGFIYGLLAGMSVEETLRFANAVAALNCREVGARTSLPRLEEVEQLLKQQPRV